MKTMPAAEAKNKFGTLMDTVQREAVAISKKGRTAAIVMPVQEYEEYKELKLEKLRAHLAEGAAQADRGEFSTKTIDEIIAEARQERHAKKV
jgi:prevent-host-death family protein